MPLTLYQFKKWMKSEESKKFLAPKSTCNCGSPLEEIAGERFYLGTGKDKTQVCQGCYFDDFGNNIEKNPIYNPKTRRFAA